MTRKLRRIILHPFGSSPVFGRAPAAIPAPPQLVGGAFGNSRSVIIRRPVVEFVPPLVLQRPPAVPPPLPRDDAADVRAFSEWAAAQSSQPSSVAAAAVAAAAVNDFTRARMRESGILRQLLPPVTLTNEELDQAVTIDRPVRVIDAEQTAPANHSLAGLESFMSPQLAGLVADGEYTMQSPRAVFPPAVAVGDVFRLSNGVDGIIMAINGNGTVEWRPVVQQPVAQALSVLHEAERIVTEEVVAERCRTTAAAPPQVTRQIMDRDAILRAQLGETTVRARLAEMDAAIIADLRAVTTAPPVVWSVQDADELRAVIDDANTQVGGITRETLTDSMRLMPEISLRQPVRLDRNVHPRFSVDVDELSDWNAGLREPRPAVTRESLLAAVRAVTAGAPEPHRLLISTTAYRDLLRFGRDELPGPPAPSDRFSALGCDFRVVPDAALPSGAFVALDPFWNAALGEPLNLDELRVSIPNAFDRARRSIRLVPFPALPGEA